MNLLKFYCFFLILCFLTGCQSVSIPINSSVATSDYEMFPGAIGLTSRSLINHKFKVKALPEYRHPIRLGVRVESFTPSKFKRYLRVNPTNTLRLNYVDSIKKKPDYVNLEILDKVGLLSELDAAYNDGVDDYLYYQQKAQIVTRIEMALDANLTNEILQAEAVFLIRDAFQNYKLDLHTHGESFKMISFSQGTIFSYDTSFFCWAESEKGKIEMVDLVNSASACPNKTYKSRGKAKKKQHHFSFR